MKILYTIIFMLILLNTNAFAICKAIVTQPDPTCTPGDTMPNFTMKEACSPNYTKTVRNVPEKLKNEVLKEYGYATKHEPLEIDHFISLVIGGSNDIKNLWPEPLNPRPGFREKDVFENYLHRQICKGAMTIEEAQREITTDWYRYYKESKSGNAGEMPVDEGKA